MSGKKKLLALVLAAAVVLSAAAGIGWILWNNYIIDFHLYPKTAVSMDLRGEEISIRHYNALKEKLPKCRILWDVPFQDGTLPNDTTEITVDTLTSEDVAVLAYLPQLSTVYAENCTDYDNLMLLKDTYPDVTVHYQVTLDGVSYSEDTDVIELRHITEEEMQLLPYLRKLNTVRVGGDSQAQDFSSLSRYCQENGLAFLIRIGGNLVSPDVKELAVENITDDDLQLLSNLPNLRRLHMVDPQAAPENVTGLQSRYPDMEISWEVQIADQVFQNTDTEIDLSATVITDLSMVEQQMAYLPDAETVIFGLCGIDNPKWGASKTKNLAICEIENEDMAAYRDRVRDQYKVVWTVRLGPSIALRTDKDNFMPNHFGVGQLFNDYAYNLRYCEDMVCLDVGHMTLTDISFVEYMPKLKYLILAWTEVQYIEPIRSCKNLIWLELDNSCIRDYSPLVDCTALEDLNIGKTFCDITPILQMTWLKNLYMIFGSGSAAWQASQALPDTHVVATGDATVGGGWRRLPNYYDMRDCLGMYYMN
ncbi:MAG: hypothetical protein ACI3WQ_10245 [Faecousia sp.]